MITCLCVREDLNLRAEPARFLSHNRADAIHGGFVVRGRFGFHKTLEKRV
jgi:hypothetical protein